MPIYGALRVKNEARWIGRVIDSIRWVCACGSIIVLDDGSTDDTREIAAAHGAVVVPSPFGSRGYIDEAEDKDFLLEQVWRAGAQLGDHVLMIDGDEELCGKDREKLLACQQHEAAAFRIIYLWNDENTVRVDRWYAGFRRPSMFRLTSRELKFWRTAAGGNFHCSNVPSAFLRTWATTDVQLLHYGYLHREDRIRKFEFYNNQKPVPPGEDGYRHMVVGDLFPANSRFVHAGPLELRSRAALGL